MASPYAGLQCPSAVWGLHLTQRGARGGADGGASRRAWHVKGGHLAIASESAQRAPRWAQPGRTAQHGGRDVGGMLPMTGGPLTVPTRLHNQVGAASAVVPKILSQDRPEGRWGSPLHTELAAKAPARWA